MNPAPLVCLLGGPFRGALGGKGTCLQITLPMHHPPAHLAPMYPLLAGKWGDLNSIKGREVGANIC